MLKPQKNRRSLASILNLLVLEDGPWDNTSLAIAACVSDSKMSRVRNEDAHLRDYELIALSNTLAEHNELRVARILFPPTLDIVQAGVGSANGCLNDENARATVALGQAIAAHQTHDVGALDESITELRQVLKDLQAERNRLAMSHTMRHSNGID